MLDRFKVQLQYFLPKQRLTQLAGWFANQSFGWLTHLIIKGFIKFYRVNMQEAAQPAPEAYNTFNEFFVRPLKEGARPVVAEENQLAFPVDGVVSQSGPITEGKLLQAKGHEYSLDALLACNTPMVETFTNGAFATIYLSPKDYHRVHMPCDGVLREMLYVPGELFSVNPLTAENVPNLFARNERVICLFDTAFGPMAQILVGATIVGSIETVWAGTIAPPRKGILERWTYPAAGKHAIRLKKGEEMGRFKLGSTVITLFAENSVTLMPTCQPGTATRMGEAFAVKFDPQPIEQSLEE